MQASLWQQLFPRHDASPSGPHATRPAAPPSDRKATTAPATASQGTGDGTQAGPPGPTESPAVAEGDTPTAAKQINQIRMIVATNLVLGLVTAAVGASGRYWA